MVPRQRRPSQKKRAEDYKTLTGGFTWNANPAIRQAAYQFNLITSHFTPQKALGHAHRVMAFYEQEPDPDTQLALLKMSDGYISRFQRAHPEHSWAPYHERLIQVCEQTTDPLQLAALLKHGLQVTHRQTPMPGTFFDYTCDVLRQRRENPLQHLGAADLLHIVHPLSNIASRTTSLISSNYVEALSGLLRFPVPIIPARGRHPHQISAHEKAIKDVNHVKALHYRAGYGLAQTLRAVRTRIIGHTINDLFSEMSFDHLMISALDQDKDTSQPQIARTVLSSIDLILRAPPDRKLLTYRRSPDKRPDC